MKKIIILLLCLLLIGCTGTDIKNRALKHSIENTLRKQGLPYNEYESLTHLDAAFLGIDDLSGIEKLENLESLSLSDNQISDLKPLENLKKLKILDIQNNLITDLSSLKNLETLEILLIRGNPLKDLETLQDEFSYLVKSDFIVNIDFPDYDFDMYIRRQLGKDEGNFTHVELNRIRSIDLTGLNVEDISGIENLKGLTSIKVPYKVSGLEEIGELEYLEEVVIRNNEFANIEFLSELTKLYTLDLRNNQIVDISSLKRLTNLKKLNLSQNKIKDITPLGNLNLRELYLEGNYILDYSVIDSVLSKLETTDIHIAYFEDQNLTQAVRDALGKEKGMITMSDLKAIRTLEAESYGIESIVGLELLENLIELNLSYNNIKDLSSLEDLESLQILKLSHNDISEINSLIYAKKIKILDLSYNEIVEINALDYLSDLEYLFLSGNDIPESILKTQIKNQLKVTDDW